MEYGMNSVREMCMSNRFKTNALNLTRMTLEA